MITPQQIDQVAFKKASFGGYNMQQVDEFLEPLTEDYVTLYKENALLKSKLRVLAGKLEEYRKGEAAAPKAAPADNSAATQAACAKMMADTKARCEQLLKEANVKAQQITASAVPAAPTGNTEALIAAENARVEEARKAANARIAEIQEQMRSCIQALERIKGAAATVAPAAPAAAPKATASFVAPVAESTPAAQAVAPASFSVADEIAHNVEALVGTTEDVAPKAAPKHPENDTTTSRFANLNLQFGRNYDPTHK